MNVAIGHRDIDGVSVVIRHKDTVLLDIET